MDLQNLNTIYFDNDSGTVIAMANDGTKFEQSFEHCPRCHSLAMVMKPIATEAPVRRRCRCK